MIVGVDIGGTKTYVACFTQSGKLLFEVRFETARRYKDFLSDLKAHVQALETNKAKIAIVAVPGLLDREKGVVKSLGNLPWKDAYIQHDIAEILGITEVYIENDSNLAGLAEARYYREYKRVFYLTLSTGIGGTLIVDHQFVPELIDMEIGKTPLERNGKILAWEDFASGRAFYTTFSQKAVEVHDEKIWEQYANAVCLGLGMICANFQVDAIVFGGGLGQYFNRFSKYVQQYLDKQLHANIIPPQALLTTHYRGQSVIYGCYVYAKDKLA